MSTYVISDMHGRMDLFLKMLEKIGFSENDHLYCLGDAADRGPKGIEILLLLMQMDNVTYICGNHDLMFTKAVRRAVQMGYSEKALNTEEFQLWMLNGGASTWNRYIELERSVRREILAYIGNSYLLIPQLKVGEHYFYLCHATHAERPILEPLLLKNADRQTIEHVVWERTYPRPRRKFSKKDIFYPEIYNRYPKKTTMIFGHTPTPVFSRPDSNGRGHIWHGGNGHLIDIDCGCAVREERYAMLGCLRLEDMKEFYVHY